MGIQFKHINIGMYIKYNIAGFTLTTETHKATTMPQSTLTGTYDIYTQLANKSFVQMWIEGITPLILDAFVMHIWATPLIRSLINGAPVSSNETETFGIVSVAAILTFTVNVFIHPHVLRFHKTTSVSDSPMFRAIWIFSSAVATRRYSVGSPALSFTIITFLPLIYIRIPPYLRVVSSFYGLVFFCLSAGRSCLMFFRQESVRQTMDPSYLHDAYSIGFHWFVFLFSCIHHPIFMSSQVYISDTNTHLIENYFFVKWRHSPVPLAAFRTMVLFFCVFIRENELYGVPYKYHQAVEFLEILFLYLTISTFTAWAHCQHIQANTLRNILTTSVVAASCGMMVETIEQTAFLCFLTPMAIFFDVYYVTRSGSAKKQV